jgi:hypothetical protein
MQLVETTQFERNDRKNVNTERFAAGEFWCTILNGKLVPGRIAEDNSVASICDET